MFYPRPLDWQVFWRQQWLTRESYSPLNNILQLPGHFLAKDSHIGASLPRSRCW